jgi:transposase
MANLDHYNQRSFFNSDVSLSHLLEDTDLCFIIKNEIASNIKDTDFEDMYKEGGRPPISPRLLVLVLLMQFIEGLSDRSALQNLKFRLDWKIAFGLPLDFLGFHPTVLTYFRDRLIANAKGSYAFDQILNHLSEIGLIKSGGKQRIDSTHIIAAVRELTRIDLLHETLRLFCLDIEPMRNQLSGSILSSQEKYVEYVSAHRATDLERKAAIQAAGLAMRGFIEWGKFLKNVESLDSFRTLKKVYEQNFLDREGVSDPDLIKISTGKEHICNPHDPEAEYANKGKKRWLGYKLQVVETADTEQNFITNIELENATDFDGNSVERIIEELKQNGIAPSELYGDTHYNTANNIEKLAEEQIDLKGPVAPVTKEKTEKDIGFTIDLEGKKVICPEGKESKTFRVEPSGKIGASFKKEDCQSCPHKDLCKPQPRGKIYSQRQENKILNDRRELLKSEEYKKSLHLRNGIEGTLSGLVRGQKIRRLKYKGKLKGQLQAKMAGAAANVRRLHNFRLRQMSNIVDKVA